VVVVVVAVVRRRRAALLALVFCLRGLGVASPRRHAP